MDASSENPHLIRIIINGEGKDVISNAHGFDYARAWVAYDANGTKLRWADARVVQYTYQEGDAYIILGLDLDHINYANYGTTLVEQAYTDYDPVEDLKKRVSSLESTQPINTNDISLLNTNVTAVKAG